MSRHRTIVFLLVLTTLVGWGFAWQQGRALEKIQASQEALLTDHKKIWEKSLEEANRRSRRLETQLADLQRPPGADGEAPRAGPDSRAPANRPNGPLRPGTSLYNTLKENPAFAKLWTTQQKAQLDGRYSALFKRLMLQPDDLDKFKDLLVEKQNAASEAMTAARAQGINPQENKDSFNALVAQNNRDLESKFSGHLGPEKYAQYQEYEQTLSQRSFVNLLDQRLSYSSAPLQSIQVEKLVEMLAQNSASKPNASGVPGSPLITTNTGRIGAKISDATIAQAQAILLPEQLAGLIQLRSEQQLQQQLAEVTRAAARAANANSPPSPTGGTSSSSAVSAPAKSPDR